MSLSKEEKYVIFAPTSEGTLAGLIGPLEPKANFFPFPSTSSPILKSGVIHDWDILIKHWKQVYFKHLGIAFKRGDHPILFLKPKQWNKQDMERITKLLFEELQIPGLSMIPSAMAALLGTNAVTGFVIEIGKDFTDIVPINDTIVQTYASRSMRFGSDHFQQDASTFLDHLSSIISSSMQALEPSLKSTILENIILTQEAIPLKDVITPVISLYIADTNLQDQPREWKYREIPDFLEAYQGKPELNAYLGASLLAKLIFPDAKSFVSKDEYLVSGPSIIHTKSYGGITV